MGLRPNVPVKYRPINAPFYCRLLLRDAPSQVAFPDQAGQKGILGFVPRSVGLILVVEVFRASTQHDTARLGAILALLAPIERPGQ